MKYTELSAKHRAEADAFPIAFAFSNKQLKKALAKLGATEDEVVRVAPGGLIKKTDRDAFYALLERHDKELTNAMKNKKFLVEAMEYELGNHEYCVTYDYYDALGALGLDESSLNKMQREALSEAEAAYLEAVER